MVRKELQRLHEIEKELTLLKGIAALLDFDKSTIMPKAAINERADQLSYVSTKYHEIITSKEINTIIRRLATKKNQLGTQDKLVVARYQKDLVRLNKIPLSFVKKYSELTSKAFHTWEEAREKNDYALFAPYLKKIVAMKLELARILDKKKHPYDVLLYDYEEGMTVVELKRIFAELKEGLLAIITRIKKTPTYQHQHDTLKKFSFSQPTQERIVRDIMSRILQEHERTYITTSTHPFTTSISSNDVRITTAYRKSDSMFAFSSTVHEAGHALYELGYDKKLCNTILHDAPSLGIHESQSRFWEIMIAKNKPFWAFYYKKFQHEFPKLKNVSFSTFYAAYNRVRPSLVRIESDELHYCLHIIIRFELELALLERKLVVEQLPAAWNKKYKEYLGIIPKNIKEGVLQDVHWSQGYFSYFPTYALGTMYSTMLYNKIKQSHPSIENEIVHGNFRTIFTWLHERIHKHGKTKLTATIMKNAIGRKLTPQDFLRYLEKKYTELYPEKKK